MGRRRILTIDSLEPRGLLSITPLINSPGWVQTTSTGSSSGSSSQVALDPTTGTYVNPNQGSGVTSDVTPPRLNEANRRNFTASFSGRVLEEAPRLLDQSHQFYVLAQGSSSAFLHGTLQLRYYTPNPNPVTFPDPTDPGNILTEQATATTGSLSMSDRSTQSGTVILGDLTGSPADVDSKGRPTKFDLTINGGGGSGGIYASSVGSGTVTITYKGNVATVRVHASIYLNGVGNPYDIYQGINL